MLYIPTLRELNRALRVDDSDVLTKLEGLGLNHARRLLKLTLSEVLELTDPTSDPSITDAEVTRAYVITQFFNLDGMDAFTADYLFDTQGVVTLQSLGQQTVTTLNSMLATLVSSEGRPSALTQQDHARRWRLESRLYTRTVVSDHLINTRTRTFPVPVPPQHHQRSAEHFAQVSRDLNQRPNRRVEAEALATVHRFAAGFLAGNQALHLKRWPQTVGFYNSAQRALHRWLELQGSAAVDDIAGVNLYDAIDGTRQLLDALPDDPEPSLGGPAATWQGRDPAGVVYGVRGFPYSELTSTEQSSLRTSLSSVFIRQLPRQYREELGRVVMDQTLGALNTVDTNLTTGLDSYPAQSRAQDLTDADKARLMRNLGGVTVNRLYTSGGIGVFDEPSLAGRLFLWSIKDLVGSLWSASSASSVLATTPKLAYTTALLSESPFVRFVEMPGLTGESTSQFVVMKATAAAFFTEYEDNFLVPRLKSTSAADIYFPRAVWESPSAIALLMPWVYGRYVLMGLHSAHNHQGQTHSGDNYAINKVNSYDTSGALIGSDTHELAASHPAQYTDSPVDEQDSGSQAVWEQMQAEVLAAIDEADTLYRRGDLDGGHVAYELARDIIVTNQGSVYAGDLEEEVEAAIDGAGGGYDDNDPPSLFDIDILGGEMFMEDWVLVMEILTNGIPLLDASDSAGISIQWIDPSTTSVQGVPNVLADTGGVALTAFGPYMMAVDEGSSELIWLASRLIYVVAMLQQIEYGLNWLGYRSDYVPPWSFEHLFTVARDMASRAQESEQRVLSTLQLMEQATGEELQATFAVESAGKAVELAEARQDEQAAAAQLAGEQAQLSVDQAALSADQNWSSGLVTGLSLGGAGAGGAIGAVNPAALGLQAIGGVASVIQSFALSSQYTGITDQSKAMYEAQETVNVASATVAQAELDAAALQASQASDYARWLQEERILTSESYAYLFARAQEVADYALEHATRVAWLAQRALVHETRRGFNFVRTSYLESDQVADLTRAGNLAADLEALRAAYTAGETDRRQSLKWTFALSQHDPGALQNLRNTGECVVRVPQQVIDQYFPGMYLHSLQDLRLAFIGTLPPDGVRGVLSTTGYGRVRIPNTQEFYDGSRITDDWIEGLVASNADQFKIKEVLCQGATIALSQFDVRSDRAVLQTPQGMLTAVKHQGMDGVWSIKLPRTANGFAFDAIKDVEFTFWFLAAYDAGLASRMKEAWTSQAASGDVEGVAGGSFAASSNGQWQAFVRDATQEEVADIRTLTLQAGVYPPWEADSSQKLTNLLLAVAPSKGIRLRILTDEDPVGTLVTTVSGAAFTDTSDGWDGALAHQPNSTLETWVEDTFFQTGSPSKAPDGTWVIKVLPGTADPAAGTVWQAIDDDGEVATTASGPLTSGDGGLALWEGEMSVTDVRIEVKVRTESHTTNIQLRRVDVSNMYVVAIEPTQVQIFDITGGTRTPLATASLSYPDEELLGVRVDCYGDVTSGVTLTVTIDGIEILTVTDSGTPHAAGQIGLEVDGTGNTAAFDDLEVTQLSKTGVVQETLLIEPFTGSLPSDWGFTDGSPAWAISTEGHPYFDADGIQDVVLRLDYRFTMGT